MADCVGAACEAEADACHSQRAETAHPSPGSGGGRAGTHAPALHTARCMSVLTAFFGASPEWLLSDSRRPAAAMLPLASRRNLIPTTVGVAAAPACSPPCEYQSDHHAAMREHCHRTPGVAWQPLTAGDLQAGARSASGDTRCTAAQRCARAEGAAGTNSQWLCAAGLTTVLRSSCDGEKLAEHDRAGVMRDAEHAAIDRRKGATDRGAAAAAAGSAASRPALQAP